MLVGQEVKTRGDEIEVVNSINTDDVERDNWQRVQQGKGFIFTDRGLLTARHIAEIPEDEAAMLRTRNDEAGMDFFAFETYGDKDALRRLLKRFPHWRCSSGGF